MLHGSRVGRSRSATFRNRRMADGWPRSSRMRYDDLDLLKSAVETSPRSTGNGEPRPSRSSSSRASTKRTSRHTRPMERRREEGGRRRSGIDSAESAGEGRSVSGTTSHRDPQKRSSRRLNGLAAKIGSKSSQRRWASGEGRHLPACSRRPDVESPQAGPREAK